MLEQYLARAIVRHLDGDRERFQHYVEQATELYKRDKHLYVSIEEMARVRRLGA